MNSFHEAETSLCCLIFGTAERIITIFSSKTVSQKAEKLQVGQLVVILVIFMARASLFVNWNYFETLMIVHNVMSLEIVMHRKSCKTVNRISKNKLDRNMYNQSTN